MFYRVLAASSFLFLQATTKLPFVGPLLSSITTSTTSPDDLANVCASLASSLDLSTLNTTILGSTYYHDDEEAKALGICQPTALVGAGTCRVQFVVNTSSTSSLKAEAWLPAKWNKRMLGLGNLGLNGCIDYYNLEYGNSLGFASVGTDNGHDGMTAEFFSDPEVLADYTSRAVHAEAVVGKRIIEEYYAHPAHHSYYLGCSTGGRQGLYSAMYFPEDFDGILAGAPPGDYNSFVAWLGLISWYAGARFGTRNPDFITPQLWELISAEAIRQCDAIDGVVDGLLTEPDACDFRLETLLCKAQGGSRSGECLNLNQVQALRKIYAPVYGLDGQPRFVRFDPGAELGFLSPAVFTEIPNPFTYQWMKYVVLNSGADSDEHIWQDYNLTHFESIRNADIDKVSTFHDDFFAFRARGGKILTYHGRKDEMLPSGHSKFLYNHFSRMHQLSVDEMDEFYRLFLVPGLHHCFGGPGEVDIGQWAPDGEWAAGAPELSSRYKSRQKIDWESKRKGDNALLRLVDWVEYGKAPDTIVGQSTDGERTREHCRYPQKSVWNATEAKWVCVA